MIVRFKFQGGCKDGAVIVGEDDLRLGIDKNPAHAYLFLTKGGRVGERFREPLPDAIRQGKHKEFTSSVGESVRAGKKVPKGEYPPDYHIYEVTERQVDLEGISIRVDYVGEEFEEFAAPGGEPPDNLRRASGIETLDDFRRMLVDPGSSFYRPYPWLPAPPRVVPRETSPLSVKAERYVKMIDVMTDVERHHPSTLIDRWARQRIAQDAGAHPKKSSD